MSDRLVLAVRLPGTGDVYIPERGLVREGDTITMPEDEALGRSDFRVSGEAPFDKPAKPAPVQNIPARATAGNTTPAPSEEPKPDETKTEPPQED